MTTVVNIKTQKPDIYIGRGINGVIPNPPENGCYGNPFSVEEYGRDGCISAFRIYFNGRIEKDEDFRLAVLTLKDKKLGCFCHPKPCHGDVYVEYLDQVK